LYNFLGIIRFLNNEKDKIYSMKIIIYKIS
jgi:hypothetical protein